jgi:hypothetical protein
VALVVHQFRVRTHFPLLLLGFFELAAAILFLVPRKVKLGGVALMTVFVVAAGIHLRQGDYNIGHLAVYCAAAFAVVVQRRSV